MYSSKLHLSVGYSNVILSPGVIDGLNFLKMLAHCDPNASFTRKLMFSSCEISEHSV
jgi:hypothetical protein